MYTQQLRCVCVLYVLVYYTNGCQLSGKGHQGQLPDWALRLKSCSPQSSPRVQGPCHRLITTHTLPFPTVSPHPLPSTSLQSFLFSLHSTSSSCRHASSEVFLQEGEVHVLTTGWYRKVDNLIAKCCTASWREADVLMTGCSLGCGRSGSRGALLTGKLLRKCFFSSTAVSCSNHTFWALLWWQYEHPVDIAIEYQGSTKSPSTANKLRESWDCGLKLYAQ